MVMHHYYRCFTQTYPHIIGFVFGGDTNGAHFGGDVRSGRQSVHRGIGSDGSVKGYIGQTDDAVHYVKGYFVSSHIRTKSMGICLRGGYTDVNGAAAQLHSAQRDAVEREPPVAVKRVMLARHIHAQSHISAESVEGHRSVGEMRACRKRNFGSPFLHIDPHSGSGRRQAKSGAVFGMRDFGDSSIKRQCSLLSIGGEGEHNLVNVKPCLFD